MPVFTLQFNGRFTVVSVILIKELWFACWKTEDWTWHHVPLAGVLKTVSSSLEAQRKSDGGRREAGFLKFFLCESADSTSGDGNVSSWTDSISFFGLQTLEVNGWGWRSWSTWQCFEYEKRNLRNMSALVICSSLIICFMLMLMLHVSKVN